MTLENISADIPASLAWADELLTLFGRWARAREIRRRCGSAEGQYRAPPNDDDRKPKELQMSTDDAMAVQRALSRVPDRERIVLEVLYVPRQWTALQQFRFMKIPPRLSRERHLSGLRMFSNIHRMHTSCTPGEDVQYNRAH